VYVANILAMDQTPDDSVAQLDSVPVKANDTKINYDIMPGALSFGRQQTSADIFSRKFGRTIKSI